MSAFEELGVMPEIITALDEMEWLLPTPVQTEAVPLILGGGDVSVAAETGSGKTGAFCLPVLQVAYEARRTSIDVLERESDDTSGPVRLSTTDRGKTVAVDAERGVAQLRHHAIWDGVRATRGVAKGRWYFVATLADKGLARVGWSARGASLLLGTDSRGFGYGATAMKAHSARFEEYAIPFTQGDTITCTVDIDVEGARLRIAFLHNGIAQGNAFALDIAKLPPSSFPLFPTVCMKNAELRVDFNATCNGAEALGFKRMGTATEEDGVVGDELSKLFSGTANGKAANGSEDGSNAQSKEPLVLILEPSRELANQVYQEINKFRKYLPADTTRQLLLIGGGSDFKQDKQTLKTGCDIVSGTLGSIVAHVKKGTLSLNSIRFFILDEADTFATDNLKDIEFLHKKIPLVNRVQTLLFSATLHSPEIKQLSEKIQSFPTWVDLKGKEAIPESVHHTMVRIDANADAHMLGEEVYKGVTWPLDKVHNVVDGKAGDDDDTNMEDAADARSLLVKKLKLVVLHKVIDAHAMSQAMLFVRSQLDGDNLESFLLQLSGVPAGEVAKRRFRGRRAYGPEIRYSCGVLHGGRRQTERTDALAAFKAGEVRFLICTDVAARGIDVAGLPFLVNVTLPDRAENYVHRVGRVGRAERLGLAVSLVAAHKEAVWYHSCGRPKNGVCSKRTLVDAGGCVLWYNEPKLLAEVEERLKGRVEELAANYKRRDENAAPILYGARAGDEKIFEETRRHVESLQPAVQQLMKMEEDAQASFFALQTLFPLKTS